MKLPCCLVGEHGEPVVGRNPHDAVKKRRGNCAAANPLTGNRANMFGLALLFASIFSDLHPTEPTMAVSKSITTSYTPSALYQLASFMAMQDNEEEERAHQERLMQHASNSGDSGGLRAAVSMMSSPTRVTGGVALSGVRVHGATRAMQRKVTVRATLEATGTLSRPLTPDGIVSSATSTSSSSATCASSSTKGSTQAASSEASMPSAAAATSEDALLGFADDALLTTEAGAAVVPPSWAAPPPSSVWQQMHVLDAAQEVGHGGLLNATHRMLSMGLFPTIYRAFLGDVAMPPAITSGGGGSTRGTTTPPWACRVCSKRHDALREACLKCGAPRPDVVKLFFGQLRKEALCDDVLLQVVSAATSGAVTPLRVEGHTLDYGRRGKGCGSVYVTPRDAEVLVALLHRNAFLDIDWTTGREVLYFAYAEQRAWLEQYAAARIAVLGANRPCTLPNKLLVCELAGGGGGGGGGSHAPPWAQQQSQHWGGYHASATRRRAS